jgi:hypothetical protein
MTDEPRPADDAHVFRRQKILAYPLLVFCVLGLAAAVALFVYLSQLSLGLMEGLPFLLAGGGVVLLCGFGLVSARHILSDNSPKLSIDQTGITDHRPSSGPRLVRWEEIHGMDCEFGPRGVILFLYLLPKQGEVAEVKVNLLGLNADPRTVFRTIRKAAIQYAGLTGGDERI